MMPDGWTIEGLAANEQFQNYCLRTHKADIAYWERWLEQHPEQKAVVAEARSLVLAVATEPSKEEIKEAFSAFRQIVDKRQSSKNAKIRAIPTTKQTKKYRLFWMGSVGCLLLLSLVYCYQIAMNTSEQYQVIASEFGELKTHIFPDGSRMVLNANSTLQYKTWQEESPRVVELHGEAFFEVVQNGRQPFLVQTAKGTIEVLGTAFTVLHRGDQLAVALLEGAVALTIPDYPIIKMTPGERVVIDGEQYQRQEADVDALSAWRFQRIVFKETPIKEVIERLSHEFDLTVTVEHQQILQRKISATIPKNDPALLLQAISEIYDLTIEQQSKKKYVIR